MAINTVNIPRSWDYEFFVQLIGVQQPYGLVEDPENEDEYTFKFFGDAYEAVMTAVETYPVAYLEVLQPKALARIAEIGKAKVKVFTFAGMTMELDDITEGRIGRAVQWLERPAQAEVTHVNWDRGVGNFVTIPKAVMFAMGDACGAHIQAMVNKRKELTDRVLAAEDINDPIFADIETTVWPGDPEPE